MSALPPITDIFSAPAHVRYGPIADIANLIGSPRRERPTLEHCEAERLGGLSRYQRYIVGGATSQPVTFDKPSSLSKVWPRLGKLCSSGVTVTWRHVIWSMLRRRV